MLQPKIRLLVVDDSVYMQMAIRTIVETCPEIEIVGEATDGEEAVTLAQSLAPDIITMDVNMPVVDGLEATRRIMASAPAPIIMLSSLTEKGVATTCKALDLGAIDYVAKSSSAIDVDLASIAEQMVSKIRFWGSRKTQPTHADAAAALPLPALSPKTDLLVVISGTGGAPLIGELLRDIETLPFPVLLVQDMPPNFTSPLMDFLSRTTRHDIREGVHHCTLERGVVRVMPGGRKGTMSRDDTGALTLNLAPAINAPMSSLEVVSSAVNLAQAPQLVVLSGEARPMDGLIAALRNRQLPPDAVWIQSLETCVADEMPRAVAAAVGPQALVRDVKTFAAALKGEPPR